MPDMFFGGRKIKHFRPKDKTSYYGIKNYFQGLKIYNQALKINNQTMKINFQAVKIVLEGELECFMRGIKSFYPSPLTDAPPS